MFEAVLAAIGGAIQAWNHHRGKTEAVERVRLGLDIARAKANTAPATSNVSWCAGASESEGLVPSWEDVSRLRGSAASVPPEIFRLRLSATLKMGLMALNV